MPWIFLDQRPRHTEKDQTIEVRNIEVTNNEVTGAVTSLIVKEQPFPSKCFSWFGCTFVWNADGQTGFL